MAFKFIKKIKNFKKKFNKKFGKKNAKKQRLVSVQDYVIVNKNTFPGIYEVHGESLRVHKIVLPNGEEYWNIRMLAENTIADEIYLIKRRHAQYSNIPKERFSMLLVDERGETHTVPHENLVESLMQHLCGSEVAHLRLTLEDPEPVPEPFSLEALNVTHRSVQEINMEASDVELHH